MLGGTFPPTVAAHGRSLAALSLESGPSRGGPRNRLWEGSRARRQERRHGRARGNGPSQARAPCPVIPGGAVSWRRGSPGSAQRSAEPGIPEVQGEPAVRARPGREVRGGGGAVSPRRADSSSRRPDSPVAPGGPVLPRPLAATRGSAARVPSPAPPAPCPAPPRPSRALLRTPSCF